MIHGEDGRKNGVLVQWMSYGYLRSNKKDLGTITINPDEYCIVIKEGKIDRVVTQTQIGAVPGFFSRLFGGNSDMQLVIVDTGKHTISVPFEAYSSDKDLIRGVIGMMIQIRGADCVNALRLLKENSPAGSASSKDGYREYRLEDVAELLKNNIRYIADTESISMLSSEEVQKKREDICNSLKTALNLKSPYWNNYGLTVNYTTVSIDGNAYEDIQRESRKKKLESLERDVEYEESQGISEHSVRLHELLNSEKAAMKMDDYLSALNADIIIRAKQTEAEHRSRLTDIDNEAELKLRSLEKKHQLEMQEAYHEQEMIHVRDSSDLSAAEKEVKLKQIEVSKSKVQSELAEIRRSESSKDAAAELEAERKKYEFEIEKQKKNYETEIDRLKKQLELDHADKEVQMKLRSIEEEEKHRREMEKVLSDNEFLLKSMQETNVVEIHKADIQRDIAAFENDADKARLQAQRDEILNRIEDARKQAADEHVRAMDLLDKMIQNTSASRGTYVPPSVKLQCPKCGCEINGNSKFCPGCGYKLGVTIHEEE